jgi:hypothetical protein
MEPALPVRAFGIPIQCHFRLYFRPYFVCELHLNSALMKDDPSSTFSTTTLCRIETIVNIHPIDNGALFAYTVIAAQIDSSVDS